MKAHLDKKTLDKLNKLKSNSNNERLQKSIGEKLKVLKDNKTVLK